MKKVSKNIGFSLKEKKINNIIGVRDGIIKKTFEWIFLLGFSNDWFSSYYSILSYVDSRHINKILNKNAFLRHFLKSWQRAFYANILKENHFNVLFKIKGISRDVYGSDDAISTSISI